MSWRKKCIAMSYSFHNTLATFWPLCELVKNLKICPSPTLGGRGFKFVRPLGDLITLNQKHFGGPVKCGALEG